MKIDVAGGSSRVGNWNNVIAHYTYAGTPENPCLILNLELDVSAYQPASVGATNQKKTIAEMDTPPWQQNALKDKENFSAICLQLEQNYDDLNIPGISGQAVSIFLTDALLRSEKIPLSPESVQSVRNFAADCLIYVAKRADEWDGDVQPARRLEIPFSLNDLSESDIIELSLTLLFEAQELPTISPVTETPVTKFECDIEDLTVSLNNSDDFAKIFESIFLNEDWKMCIGKNASACHSPDKKQSAETLAIRMGRKPNTGFYYEIQNQSIHYAPRPIARTLESATFSIDQYDTASHSFSDDKLMMAFAEVDLNAFAKTAFSAIDLFFSPRLTTAISKIDSLLPGDSETQGNLTKFWLHKRMLAGAVAETVEPIFKSSTSDEISLVAAREKIRRSLLIHLSNAFISNCAAVFNVSNVSVDRQKTGENLPGCFYGQFQKYEVPSTETEEAKRAFETQDQDYLLSAGKIEYFKSEDHQSGGWRLACLFSSEKVEQQSDFALPLAYRMTHLELGRVQQTDIRNSEEQSIWIQMAGAPIITPVGNTEFPLIRDEVPASPCIFTQTTDSNSTSANLAPSTSLPSELIFFDYPLNYGYGLSARDLVRVSVSTNNQKPSIYLKSEAHPLFAALAQFVTVCNNIYTDFEKHIGNLNDSSSPTDPEVVNAKKALSAFERIFGELAAAYEQWVNLAKGMTLSDGQPSETDSFDIVLKSGADGNARIDVINKDSDSEPLIPFVIVIQSYIQREAPDKPDYTVASYNYVLSQSAQPSENGKDTPVNYLSYESVLNMPYHTILLKGLNIFTTRNVSGQIQAFGNESVGVNETATINDCFKLFSAPAKYESPDIFPLHYSEFDLSMIKISGSTLEHYLDGFFASLLKESAGIPIRLKMAVSFSYQLQPLETDAARIVLPIISVSSARVIPEKGVSLPIISALAEQITDWTKSINPVLESSSEYNIRLEVYGEESNHEAPLVAIDNVFIKTSKIIEKT